MSIHVTLRLYGPLRSLLEKETVLFSVQKGDTIGELRSSLRARLKDAPPEALTLLQQSAFGCGETILSESDTLEDDTVLEVLPPVCGG